MNLATLPDTTDPPGVDLNHEESPIDGLKQGLKADLGKQDQSWVKAAQDKKQLRKYEVEVLQKEGIHTVPHVAKVHMVLNKIWKYGDPSTKIEVYEVNATTMRFKVSSLKSRDKILRRGMWNVVGVPMIVSKWSPKAEEHEQEEEAIPMWVHLEKVPLHMYTWEGLSFITSVVGLPVKPHQDTIACTKLDEAKIFVKVDISKVLLKEITFTKNGKSFTIKFFYPWLPARCKACDKWGHNEGVCKRKEKRSSNVNSPIQKEKAGEEEKGTPHSIAVVVEDKEEGLGSRDAISNVKSIQERRSAIYIAGGLVNEECVGKQKEHDIVVSSDIKGWTNVSPAKVGRSISNVAQESDVVVSASKFSVLSVEDIEEGEVLGEDNKQGSKVEVQEVNEDKELYEDDGSEDNVIEQQVLAETKVGKRRGRKPKTLDENPGKSSRPGFQQNLKHSVVEEWVKGNNMSFGSILETRVKESKAENIFKKVFRGWNVMTNYEYSDGGRIWLVWKDDVRVTPGKKAQDLKIFGTISCGMRDFQRMALRCNLSDMGYQGPKYTWCNKREEGIICKKLDRVLWNDSAMQILHGAYSVFEAGGCSDHLRCKIQFLPPVEKIRRPFKYVNALGKLEAFLPMVKEYWEVSPSLFHSTSAMFRFAKKLKNLKPSIRELGHEKLGNLSRKAKEAHELLCEKQKVTLLDPSSSSIQEEAVAYERWLHIAGLEEDLLNQRAKLHWLEVGDNNNKTFHNAIKTRQAQNTIREIRCGNGSKVTKHEDIKVEAVQFFSEFLNRSPEDYCGTSTDELKDLLRFRCTEDDCSALEADVTAEEIRPDFVVAVQSVFRYGFLPKGINSTILALVPKKMDSLEMRDFRPIACCNVLYKVISKIIANRLRLILPRLVSENQTAFIKGRLLLENVLLASELVKDYHKEAVSARCVMKIIDISKAFDSVQWEFVLRSLEAIGAPARFIHWIKLCISTSSFSVQVNGELAGYFQSKRGLRQGCSLSPYLFVLCMNVLSHKIDKAAQDRKFNFHPCCKALSLTHLCFADDLMIFVEGTKASVEGVLSVFESFKSWSGLSISIEKSTVYMAGVEDDEKGRILMNFPFAEGILPVRYLGLPLMTKSMRRQDYMPLIEKVRAVFRLPSKCLKEIESICTSFLWSGPQLKAGGDSLWGKWSNIYLLKKKSFSEINSNTQSGSWMWRKMLKLRDVAKRFFKKEIGNGRHISFWYDNWSELGIISDLLGDRGMMGLGIRKNATLEEAACGVRSRRTHRNDDLNRVEEVLAEAKLKLCCDKEDLSLWRKQIVNFRQNIFMESGRGYYVCSL
ncbi:uncharacterized protein LOC108820129 [Raphanus sativus]|uniref:Uncharacterized protein LOC108820129 n=1 Tax=Raphanus sativus TaxID=3726 RepID=A0A9W3CBH7_RAPSA|nr:uncharacterized protein LOC108820129 [Raphanus sativus]